MKRFPSVQNKFEPIPVWRKHAAGASGATWNDLKGIEKRLNVSPAEELTHETRVFYNKAKNPTKRLILSVLGVENLIPLMVQREDEKIISSLLHLHFCHSVG